MGLRITVDIFSGRPNPVIDVDGPDADEVLRRLRLGRKLRGREAAEPELVLGYRGLIIQQTDGAVGGLPKRFRFIHGNLFGARLSHRAEGERFEDFFSCSGLPRRVPPRCRRTGMDRLRRRRDTQHEKAFSIASGSWAAV